MYITKPLKPPLVFAWKMKAVLIAKLTHAGIKVPALSCLLLPSFRLLPNCSLQTWVYCYILLPTHVLKVLFQVLLWFEALEENNSRNNQEERSGVRQNFAFCVYIWRWHLPGCLCELGIGSLFILIIAGELRWRHFWRKIRGNTIFQPHPAVRSLGTMHWSITLLDLSWKSVKKALQGPGHVQRQIWIGCWNIFRAEGLIFRMELFKTCSFLWSLVTSVITDADVWKILWWL